LFVRSRLLLEKSGLHWEKRVFFGKVTRNYSRSMGILACAPLLETALGLTAEHAEYAEEELAKNVFLI